MPKLRVSVLLPIGLVVDGFIVDTIRPVDAASAGIPAQGGGGYFVECRFTTERGRRRAVTPHHRHDVFPFGWTSPSRVFNVIGRHTTCGIIKAFDADSCLYTVINTDTREEERVVLGELELLPPLHGDRPQPPFPVGALVAARRFGYSALAHGEIVAANGDLTYTVRYFEDGIAEADVLHRDVRRLTQRELAEERNKSQSGQLPTKAVEDRVTVRSVVLIALIGQHLATVVQTLGPNRHRAFLLSSHRVVLVNDSHITAVRPVLYDAIHSEPEIVRAFLAADDGLAGHVTWAQTKRTLKESTPTFGLPIPDSRVRDIYAEIMLGSARQQAQTSPRRIGAAADDEAAADTAAPPQRMGYAGVAAAGKNIIEDGDAPLSFADFELAFRRYRNAI